MTTLQIIYSKERDLGDGFKVRRLLPVVGRKMVGPFIFFDHMGPVEFRPGEGLDVRPHPHINLATVTYLFEGAILHRDSLGSKQVIRPGDINWMTAGRGIVHSERSPAEFRQTGGRLHGIQCWVALPREHEEVAPTFLHHPGDTIPLIERSGVEIRVLVGERFAAKSPVLSLSEAVYLDLIMDANSSLVVPSHGCELAVYNVQGSIEINHQVLPEFALGVASEGDRLNIASTSSSRLLVIGGRRLPEPRLIWWNFVASSKSRIEEAKAAWANGLFPKVPGDETEFIPLPPGAEHLT